MTTASEAHPPVAAAPMPRVIRVRDVDIAGAQLWVAVDKELGRVTPPAIVKIANTK